MAVNPFHAFAQELFSGLGPVSVRRMFGGAGLYADGVMFALIDDETIYLKADDALKGDLTPCGSIAWTYMRDGQAREMGYWRLPESALDDADEAVAWARRSLIIAKTKAAKKKPRATRR